VLQDTRVKLILIKHARPLVDPARPSHEWKLSDQGRQDASRLADRLKDHGIAKVFSSDEPKAIETAQVIASALNTPTEVAADIFEHDRSNVPHMRSGEFISHVELFFRKPDELVLGRETASECANRFAQAIQRLVSDHQASTAIAVVTHGTVLSLYLSELNAGKPFELWRRMGLPSYAVIDTATRNVEHLVEKLDA
jgi:broad specificity phosphatase PhoE